MTLEQMYREDCDRLLLLVDVFEQTNERYLSENKDELNRIEALDATKYYPPKCLHNLKALLTSSLLVQSQGLLEYYLPKIVILRSKSVNVSVSLFESGNVLDWVKCVIKTEIKTDFDFGCHVYSRLKDFSNIRNDLVHHGGYLSKEERREILNRLDGVRVVGDLYDIDSSYCRSVIKDIEDFFLKIDKALDRLAEA